MGSVRGNFMAQYSAFSPHRLFRREAGYPTPIGAGDAMARSLYCGMQPIASWDSEKENALPTGGVFNLEFSPEGSLLVAACEKKSIQLFDPLTHQRIFSVNAAHSDCVNCVKFLDGRMFATCSDDTTIALWDVRNLKKKIRSLSGHSNWVKNIEYSVKDKLLVTSGLDGSIYTWDINSYTESNLVYQRVFHASGLMRCRLSPEAKQMVMCTTGGLLVIIHDLNLSTLAQDLHGFKPNLYRLMQMSQQLIPIAAMYEHLFDRKRGENRVEFVADFPAGNDAEVVSALQIHPQGWAALSRNISHGDRSEWSCIHDIQPDDAVSEKATRDTATPPPAAARRPRRRQLYRPRSRPYRWARSTGTATETASTPPSESPPVGLTPPRCGRAGRSPLRPEPSNAGATAAAASLALVPHPSAPMRPPPGLSSIQNDVWEASITIRQRRLLHDLASRGQVGRNFNMQRIMGINTGIAPPPAPQRPPRTALFPLPPRTRETESSFARIITPGDSLVSTAPSTSGQTPRPDGADEEPPRHSIRQNRDRLLYYSEETNEGKGFIKELCYSADGRLVCSPFGRGMRLLALNPHCSELSQCMQDHQGPAAMVEVGRSLGYHPDLVVSAKFCPRRHLLVTGCLEGRIVWYAPFSGETP